MDAMKRRRASRGGLVVAVLAVLALLSTSTGCGPIGMGIGATVPRFEPVAVTSNKPLPRVGQEVRVHAAETGQPDTWIEGRNDGVRDGAVVVSNDSGEHPIPTSSVREMEKRRGSYWGTGLAVGVVIDVIVVGCLVTAAAVSVSRGGNQ